MSSTAFFRTSLVAGLVLVLAACGTGPQQPSDEVDDRSAESPYLGGAEDEEPAPETSDFTEFAAEGGDASAPPGDSAFEDAGRLADGGGTALPELDPIVTGDTLEPTSMSDIVGSWVTNPADCASGSGTLVTITTTRFERVGQQCDIASTIDGGDGSMAATLSCPTQAGGTPTSEIVKLAPQDDGTLQLNIVGSEEPVQTLERCP